MRVFSSFTTKALGSLLLEWIFRQTCNNPHLDIKELLPIGYSFKEKSSS